MSSAAAKNRLRPILWSCKRVFCNQSCHSNSNHCAILTKRLVEEPKSRLKTTLDSYDFQSSRFPWESLLTSLASSSSPDKARMVLEWRLEKLLNNNERNHHDSYSQLISLCGKIHDLQLAMSIFTSLEAHGIELSSAIFNSLIHVCFSSNNVLSAFSLFEIMESGEGFKPNSETYDSFISGFSKLGNVGTMKTWYSAKKAAGLAGNLHNFESLISGCVKSGDLDTDRFYEEMMLIELKPNMPILENMLEGFCRRRNSDQVQDFLRLLIDGGMSINECMAEKLVGLYIELGKVEEMEKLLATLIESNQVSEVLLVVHCGIIRMYAMLDRLDLVEYAIGRMLKQGLSFRRSDDVEKVICSYFRQAAYDRLDLFLERIKGSYEIRRSTYDLLISGYRRARLQDKVDLVMNDMKLAGLLRNP